MPGHKKEETIGSYMLMFATSRIALMYMTGDILPQSHSSSAAAHLRLVVSEQRVASAAHNARL